jgi:hyperosmotically inducible protein
MNTIASVLVLLGLLTLPVQGQASDAKGTKDSVKEVVADSVITTRIKSEYAKDKEVSALRIHVETDAKGIVTLTGEARSRAEMEKAGKLAGATQGVTQVRNNIQVVAAGSKPTVTQSVKENVADAVITTKIKAEYAKDKDVSALNVKVDTDDKGVVTLSGTAKTTAEADKAARIARETKGVTSVRNDIRVQPK